jgi:hypothetical protein
MTNAKWSEPWLYHLEGEIVAARSASEAKAVWDSYGDLLEPLRERNWEAYNDAWLRLHRLARLLFLPQSAQRLP